MGDAAKCVCCSCCCLVVAALICILMSISTLPINTWGLDYSRISKSINDEVFDSGFHYLGFMHKFIEYPSQIQSIDFSEQYDAQRGPIESRSKDGLEVQFSVQFQYVLQQAKVKELYLTYGEDYKNPCVRFSVDLMNDKATDFSASQFFSDLGTVQETMRKSLTDLWDSKCRASLTTLQVSKAKLPLDYENALQTTQIAQQAGITAKQTQENTRIDMETLVKQARITAPNVITQAQASVNATLATNLAAAQSYFQVTQAEALSYQMMQTDLAFSKTDDSQLLNYIKVKTIGKYNPTSLILGTKQKAVTKAKK